MKILKTRNGIALVAVLVIMLLTSLFIPVIFNLSNTSIRIAIAGTDRQRSSYFARTICEMSVAAFKNFDSDPYTKIDPNEIDEETGKKLTELYTDLTEAEKATLDPLIAKFNELKTHSIESIDTQTIYMFEKAAKGPTYVKIVTRDGEQVETRISKKRYEELLILETSMRENDEDPGFTVKEYENGDTTAIVYAIAGTDEYTTYTDENSGYTLIGEGKCTIKYDDSTHYYVTNNTTQAVEEVDEDEYNAKLNAMLDPITGAVVNDTYSVSKEENKNMTFTADVTVKGIHTTRSCVLVLQTYPSDEDWVTLGIGEVNGKKVATGGNQVFVDPAKASARIPITYDTALSDGAYTKQTLLVYSAVGNMLIEPAKLYDKNKPIKDAGGNIVGYEEASTGVNNSEFVLGIQPGLNTTPNDDPTYEVIDAVNYNSSKEIAEMNNFVAFTSTNAIQVDMPVNLLVNPCRANRLGDNITKTNGSLYKVMMFQAPTIQFNRRLDMMMSFYVPTNNSKARRMSSIVLMAPESTPYSYYNSDRRQVVKAGMVYFEEDCYLWIIPYGEDGSASSWAGFLSETVYERDSDFTKIKIANAGDVYYFNSDVKVDGERVGLSLTGYFLEMVYIPQMNELEKKEGWKIWSNAKTAIFSSYMNGVFGEQDRTYEKDDLKFFGNMKVNVIEPPEIDDYYVIWSD